MKTQVVLLNIDDITNALVTGFLKFRIKDFILHNKDFILHNMSPA